MNTQEASDIVSISYFDPFNIFDGLRIEFQQRLPLVNLHWKSKTGQLKTITELPIEIVSASERFDSEIFNNDVFVHFIIVTCNSVDDYRSKVRPLIKQWLPENDLGNEITRDLPSKNVIILHSNAEVTDSNIFKTISLVDKFNKDFPTIKTLEMKTVYKSEKEKEYFWSNIINQLKQDLLDIFDQRISVLNEWLLNQQRYTLEQTLILHEKILKLYLNFNIPDLASGHLDIVRTYLVEEKKIDLLPGTLDIPFKLSQNSGKDRSIGKLLSQHKLTRYQMLKYFFTLQFELIQKSSFSTDKCQYIYRLTKNFITELDKFFNKSPDWLQFVYFFYEELLNLDIANYQSTLMSDIYGEWRLMQRDCWLQLVYYTTNFRILFKSFPNVNVSYTCDKLKHTIDSEETFHRLFFNSTKMILTKLSKSPKKRHRIMDWLSVEIAILHYQRGEYDCVIDVFQSCYDFYMQTNWKFIGYELLELFVDALLHLPNTLILKIDGEDVPILTVLSNCFLNLLTNSKKKKSHWWHEFMRITNLKCSNLVYPLDNLFNVTFSKKLFISKPNTYAIKCFLTNESVPDDVMISSIRLLLKNCNDEFLSLECLDSTIKPGINEFILETTIIQFGFFELISLEIYVGDTIFSKEIDSSKIENILMIEDIFHTENFNIFIEPSRKIKLNHYTIDIGYENIENIDSFESNISILPENDEKSSSATFDKAKNQTTFSFNTFSLKSISCYMIKPYSSFKVKQVISFTRCNITYNLTRIVKIDLALPISVSVEDIFKKDFFAFKFLISSASTDTQAILKSSHLYSENVESYNLTDNFMSNDPIILGNGENNQCLNVYRIKALGKSKFDYNDVFNLHIEFNTLTDYFEKISLDILSPNNDKLTSDDIREVEGLVKWSILPKILYDYAFFRSKNILRIKNNINDFFAILDAQIVEPSIYRGYIKGLKKLKNGIKLSLCNVMETSSQLKSRFLIIPVTLPPPRKLFAVQLSFQSKDNKIGEPIKCNVDIRDNTEYLTVDDDTIYIFEITNNDDWLIGGQNRIQVSKIITYLQVDLIPLKRGYLRYPRIEILSNDPSKACEVDYYNINEVILIL